MYVGFHVKYLFLLADFNEILIFRDIQGGARNVIPFIVHITHFIFTKAFDIWYRINPHRLENCS